jgi:hypothetical protein
MSFSDEKLHSPAQKIPASSTIFALYIISRSLLKPLIEAASNATSGARDWLASAYSNFDQFRNCQVLELKNLWCSEIN